MAFIDTFPDNVDAVNLFAHHGDSCPKNRHMPGFDPACPNNDLPSIPATEVLETCAVRRLMEHTAEHVKRTAPQIYSRERVEMIFVQPYCRIGNLVESGIAQRQTASVYLKALAAQEVGVLLEYKAGREKLFINMILLKILYETN